MRCFVALDLPSEVRRSAAARVDPLRGEGDVRWVDQQRMHLTLKFLGEQPESVVREMVRALDRLPARPLDLSLGGIGRFPPRGPPRVIWVSVAGEGLDALAGAVEDAAFALGVPRERRPFRAHMTVGRVRSARGAARLCSAMDAVEPASALSFRAETFALYQSVLSSRGPAYTVLARRSLGAQAS
ncbi:MAG: RNA 2',3'-cyclic phosphodiesterase [Planctomycetota bacterium]